jgi:predicted ABC-type ATPase
MDKHRELFLFAGPNGSGKSTIVNDFLKRKSCPPYYICPDNNLDNRLKDNKEAYILAMQKAEIQRYNAIRENKSFSFESVFSTKEKLDFLEFAKSKKYFITAVYITTNNPKINIDRIRKRVLQGGHDVPKDKVILRYYKSMEFIREIIEVADNFFLYDNSFHKPVIIFEKTDNCEMLNPDYINKRWITKFLKMRLTSGKVSGKRIKSDG